MQMRNHATFRWLDQFHQAVSSGTPRIRMENVFSDSVEEEIYFYRFEEEEEENVEFDMEELNMVVRKSRLKHQVETT
ncbi:hypothetical protein PR048_009367 [Dryococelus australis]|uniref:Uncharacterized protein n=1 Tax=Dryococelus australis TaxID=614101 RepID=A0ABQ9HZP3_9NEOP|nr:hypothetical protein PR048_009367 [Dryococelus australis]